MDILPQLGLKPGDRPEVPESHAQHSLKSGLHALWRDLCSPLLQRIDLRLEVRPSVGFTSQSSKPVSPWAVHKYGSSLTMCILISHVTTYSGLSYLIVSQMLNTGEGYFSVLLPVCLALMWNVCHHSYFIS